MRAAVLAACLVVGCSSNDSTENPVDSSPDVPLVDSASDVVVDSALTPFPDAGHLDADADAPLSTTPILYVATGDGKISTYEFSYVAGALTPKGSFDVGNYPSFLAFDVAHLHAYAVLEASNQVAAFSIAKGTGALASLGTVSSPGEPTHVSLDRDGAHVMVANYSAGTTIVFALNADGSIGAATDHQSPGNLAHQILVDPTNAFAFVPCKGSDLVAQFHYDATKGALSPNGRFTTAAGDGPRHLAFDPSGKHAYLIDELDSTIQALAYDSTSGTLTHLQTTSTLPSGVDASKNTGAEVQVAPSGKYVFASNRGDDSIVTFTVAADGTLGFAHRTPTGGKTPRHFSLDDTGVFLFVANQGSSNVVTFRVHDDGSLSSGATTPTSASPYWVGLVNVPNG